MTASAFGQLSFTNPQGPITINDNNKASPFPSTNFVQGTVGVLEKVTVRLNGVTHGYPDDIDMVLRGPGGQMVYLWSDAGGQFDLGNADVVLDSTSSTALPNEALINSGSTYAPANYDGGDSDGFFGGLPVGTISNNLNVFSGLSGNDVNTTTGKTWELYVADDTVVDNGSIRSWVLNLYMSPTLLITNDSPVAVTEDLPQTINVFVNDADTPLSSLTLSATSDNEAIIKNSGLVFGGNTGGTNRTLTITPVANETGGPVTITVTVKDEQNQTFSGVNVQTFTVNVTPVNDDPVLTLGTSSTAIDQGGISTNIFAKVTDVDSDPAAVVLTAISSNPNVVSATNVLFRHQETGGTTGTNRVIQITPTGSATGSATITVLATDPTGASTRQTINVTVNGIASKVFANTNNIAIPDAGPAGLNPSPITVSGVSGPVGKAVISLINVEHPDLDDVGVLLVSPDGQKIVLARGAGSNDPVGGSDVNDVRLSFDAQATSAIPDGGSIVTGTYLPGDYGPSGNFPGAPEGPYSTDLGSLAGTTANGVWNLYVYDSSAGPSAPTFSPGIKGGWVLQIFPAPNISTIGNRSTAEDTAISFTFTVSDQDGSVTNITATSSNTSIVPNPTVTLGGANGDQTRTVSFSVAPVANQSGTVTISVIAKDNSGGFTSTQNFNLTVTPVNDDPTQSVIPKQLARAGQSVGPVTFTIDDIESAESDLTVTATSNNPKLLPPGAIVLGGTGGTRTITIFPAGAQGGQADITVRVSDPQGASSSQTFDLTVNAASSPLFENLGGIEVVNPVSPATSAKANPYPSIIPVSGLVGTIAEVQVAIFGIIHPRPDDLDVLLVGPGATPVAIKLMSDAGDTGPLNSVTLRFRQSATGLLPDETQIASGDYQPTDYTDIAGGTDFPAFDSPAANATSLNAFNGTNPNGDWKLYIVDDSTLERGGIISSWQLSIRTRPVLAEIPDQTTLEDTALRFTANVGDNQPGVPYVVKYTASTVSGTPAVIVQSIVTSTGETIGASGATVFGGSQTFTINPVADAFGTNSVQLTFTDPDGVSVSRTFNFIVTPVNDIPRFGTVDNKTTPAATPISFTFTVTDPEGTSVNVIGSSTRQDVVPDANIVVSPASGTASTRTVTITPAGVSSGETTISLTATDADSQKATKTFTLTVTPNVSFVNSNPIVINDLASASPYPSSVNVSGVNGTVSGAQVVLVGLTHPFPDDVDVLLVAPDGKAVMLMSDAGGATAASNLRLTFSSGGATLPDEGALSSTVYAPANYSQSGELNEMPSPAPAAPGGGYSTSLATLAGVNPNGEWKLYVRDDTFPDGGQISGGWILLLQTAPTITQVGTQTITEDTVLPVRFTVSDQDTPVSGLTVSWTVAGTGEGFDDPGLLPNSGISLVTNSVSFPNTSYTLSILAATNRPSTRTETNRVTINVTDGTTSASTSFLVRVTPVDDAPEIAGAFVSGASFSHATNRVVIAEDNSATLQFKIKDVDSTIGTSSNIVVQSSNTTLIPNQSANITITGSDNVSAGTEFTVSVALTPLANRMGSTTLNFIVSDRTQSSTNQVLVEVTPVNDLPTIVFPGMNSTEPRTNVIAGGSINNIAVTVNDIESAAQDIIVTATSSNQSLIPNQNILVGGRGSDRTISLTTVGTVTSATDVTITVVADDQTPENAGKTTRTFVVRITPPPGSVFANSNTIQIPASGKANTYPSIIPVGGMIGTISKVSVSIDGLTHTAPDDLDIVLVSPTGKKVLLMSDAGGRNAVSNVQLFFDNTGRALPDENTITSGTYQPSNYEAALDVFPDGPAAPFASSLDEFNGASPNGNWSLYVVDDAATDSGSINVGWSLRIETGPTISLTSGLNAPPSPATATYAQFNEDATHTLQIVINDMVTPPQDLAVSFVSSDTRLLQAINTNWVSQSGNAATIDVALVPAINANGTNNLTIVVRRSDGAQANILVPMNIQAVNDPAQISRLIDRTTPADTALTVPISITDVDTAFNRIWITATSGNHAIIHSTNVLLAGITNVLKGPVANATNIAGFPLGTLDTWTNFITIVPYPAVFSETAVPITIAVQEVDAEGGVIATVTSSFNVTVTKVNHNPTISGLPSVVAVEAGKNTTNIVFSVGDPDNDSPLTITATSSDQTLVRDSDIAVNIPSGAPGSRTVQVRTQSGVQGDATITLRVTDPAGARAVGQFVVRLTPTRELVFSNRSPITIRDNNSANPYPSEITVSGFSGNVSKVTVTLNGFWHTFPDDADLLLVSPAGQKVILMSDAGGSTSVPSSAALNLKFDDTDGDAIAVPDSAPLTTATAVGGIRTYKVANNEGSSTDDFANRTPAGPAGPYADTLSTFNGSSPNGVWKLYAIDDEASDSGAITNGWSIGITTLPVLVGLSDATSEEDRQIRMPFTIAEEAFANPGNYTFSVSSTNTALVPSSTNSIVITGSGTNRTVTIIPTANANSVSTGGPSLITLTEETTGVSASFKVTFTAVNDQPAITPVGDQTLAAGTFITVPNFNYSDVETAKKDLIISTTSSNPAVIPPGNVVISGTDLRIFAGTQAGTSQIGITITDTGDGTNPAASSKITFNVTVAAGFNAVGSNTNGIAILDNARANPYPSTIDIRGVNGTVNNVTVTVTGLTHSFPDDVDILLVGPNGKGVVLMSDAGAGGNAQTALNNAWLIFDDSASQNIPDNGAILPFNAYKPSNYEVDSNEFIGAGPAGTPPAGPYTATLAGAFGGISPNGVWSLYVQDDASPDAGSISGWVLNIALNEVGPILGGLVDTNAQEDAAVQIPFTVGSATPDSVTFVTSASNTNLVSSIRVGGSGTDRLLQITLVPNQSGESQITVAATDATGTRTRIFKLTVTPVNDAPVLAQIPDQSISGPTTIQLNVTDVDTATADLTFNAATTGVGLISSITFNQAVSPVTATITPVANAAGTETVTISVSDGSAVSRSTFNVRVGPVGPPVLEPIANVTTPVGQVVSVPLSVSDTDTAIADLTFFYATEQGTNIAQNISFNLTSSNTVVMTITPGLPGTDRVTVSVSDGTGVSRQAFNFTVGSAGPVIGPIANQVTLEDVPVSVPITVTPSDATLAGTSNNTNLVRNITIINVGGSISATVNLVTNAFGDADVTISATSEGVTSTRTFHLTVTAVCEAPVIAAIPPQNATGSSITVTIPVTDPDDSVSSLAFSAATAGNTIVSGVTFNTNGPITATFTLFANATGTEQVTVSASDGCAVGRQTFSLTVGGAQQGATLGFGVNGTNFVITINGAVGASFVVENSTNLTQWGFVQAVTIGANGTAQVTVPLAGRASFYRARGGTTALTDVTRPGDPIIIVNGQDDGDGTINTGGLNPPANESVDHIIDNVGQKYLNFLDLNSGFIVTPSVGSTVVTGLRLWTANDSEPRDPSSYKFEGSTTGTNGFALISQGALALPAGRNPGGTNVVLSGVNYQEVFFSNSAAYTMYRLTFPTTKGTNAAAANSMQIAEVELLGK